jgi:hypothetical protein
MSVAKFHDDLIVRAMLREAVEWFHEARREPDNEAKPLEVLARECANGSFQTHSPSIPVQRREAIARKFMAACRERFKVEIQQVVCEPEAVEAIN